MGGNILYNYFFGCVYISERACCCSRAQVVKPRFVSFGGWFVFHVYSSSAIAIDALLSCLYYAARPRPVFVVTRV